LSDAGFRIQELNFEFRIANIEIKDWVLGKAMGAKIREKQKIFKKIIDIYFFLN
jgi:hypothetical protein